MAKKAKETKKQLVGIVSSDKMLKSRVVYVEGVKVHPEYGKILKTRKKFMAHDDKNKSKVGDRILMQESVPISKRKRWEIVEILSKAE
jgi:small subunit ribosomal protein S17